jgi:hypothetical protein
MFRYIYPAVLLWILLMCRAFRIVPGVLFTITVTYMFFMIGYLVWHPEVVAKGFFAILDMIPNYAAYATKAIADQVAIEITARLR